MTNPRTSRWARTRRFLDAHLERVTGGFIVTGPLEGLALEQGRDIDWTQSRQNALPPTTDEQEDE